MPSSIATRSATPGRATISASQAELRGRADVVIVTGSGTGRPTDLSECEVVRARGHRVWVGSGVRPETASAVRAVAMGAIVGTYLHADDRIDAPLDPERVARMVSALA